MNNAITNPKFFIGGNATFTVSNPTGDRYTFRIGRKTEEQPFFVSLLTGSDNENNYTYLGLYNHKSHWVALTPKSKFKEDSLPVKVVRWAIKKITSHSTPPFGYSIIHSGKCCVCGRTLTTPQSIEQGIGPECIKKLGW